MPTTNYIQIIMIQDDMRDIASSETAEDPYMYVAGTLIGHSGPAAYTIQQIFGGSILYARVDNEPHYWNRLPNGEQIDLTAEAYGSKEGLDPIAQGQPWKGKDIPTEWRDFYEKVEDQRL